MKKIYKRILAYFIDILLVIIVVSCFTNNNYTNPQLKNYTKNYKEYQTLTKNYQNFTNDIKKYYDDKKLTEKEYNNLTERNENYKKYIDKYYQDKKLTSKNYQKLTDEVNKDFQKKYKKIYKTINKYSIIYNIYYIIAIILYFVIFNKITKGQTLGKKLLKLKIVNNKDESSNISILNYLIRATILYNPLYYLAMILGVYTLSINSFYTWGLVWSNIKDYLEVIIMLMVIIKLDGRGLHDILSKTKVVALDKEGNIIQENNGIINVLKSNNTKEEQPEVIKSTQNKTKNKKSKKIIIDENSEDK